MNKYFNVNDSLYDITEKYPETILVFSNNGMVQIKNEDLRKKLGKNISLSQFANIKNKNLQQLITLLNNAINNNKEVSGYKEEKNKNNITIKGLLPCPVRLPLEEKLQNLIKKNKNINTIVELKAASTGTDWLENDILKAKNEDDLPDIFISAGFELFFDKNLIGKFKKQNIFEDFTNIKPYNDDFKKIKLEDPDNQYSIIGVVPAVFLINTNELNGRNIPTKWSDLFKPEFENKISLPVGDFDLFNSLLLNIYKLYGIDGIKKLSKSMMKSLHPAEMVKSETKQDEKPIVTIMPNFFTKMIRPTSSMKAIWPEEGSIISPIFMLTKKKTFKKSKTYIDLFASKEIGEILSHNGLFPSTNPEVYNDLPDNSKFIWLGWDFIKNNDIAELIKKCNDIFNN